MTTDNYLPPHTCPLSVLNSCQCVITAIKKGLKPKSRATKAALQQHLELLSDALELVQHQVSQLKEQQGEAMVAFDECKNLAHELMDELEALSKCQESKPVSDMKKLGLYLYEIAEDLYFSTDKGVAE